MPSAAFITGDFAMNVNPPQPNGCAWYRMVLPSRTLPPLGWETAVGLPRVSPEAGIGVAHGEGVLLGFDVSVFKLLMHGTTPHLFRLMQSKGSRIIVDVDDFHYGLHEENVAASSTNPYTNPESNRAFYEMGIRAADTVTVSTEFLADFYDKRVRDVRLIRNALDVDRFTPVDQPEKPIFGWVGATYWRSGDIELLQSWLPTFAEDYGIKVHHSGHIPNDPKHFGVRAGLRGVNTSPMALITEYPSLLQNFHVGLVPLTRIPFNESKSFLKGLEYAASGIPFIATPTKEYEVLHAAGVGRLAETADEWRDHAIELMDVNIRREEAQRQRRIVEQKFHINLQAQSWDTALRG
jgi:hypothetical protein